MSKRRQKGFTLIELLVVIAIIGVLMAILFPVFKTVRDKAKQTHCISNLQQISAALKAYRQDFGRYPPPPYYDATAARYVGGISALVPDYLTDRKVLICPTDRQIAGSVAEAAKDNCYSSYNGWVADPSTSWDFAQGTFHRADDETVTITGPTRYYNYFGYCQEGADPHYYNSSMDHNVPYLTTTPTWLTNQGLRLQHYPRLMNRYAPDNTYITHCVHHRASYGKPAAMMDIYLTVGGSAKIVNVSQMDAIKNGASRWVRQQD